MILCCQAGIHQIAFDMWPVLQATIIKHLQVIGNDKRHMPIGQALLEHQEPPHTPVSILKRVYTLEAMMQIEDILESLVTLGIVFL